MSLLDRGESYEPVTVYPEEVYTDDDGNTMTRASTTGIQAIARFQVQGQSGTSSRKSEEQSEGFESEKVYTMRFTRKCDRELGELGAQSDIVWRGKRWELFGDINYHNGSRRTSHNMYRVRRR